MRLVLWAVRMTVRDIFTAIRESPAAAYGAGSTFLNIILLFLVLYLGRGYETSQKKQITNNYTLSLSNNDLREEKDRLKDTLISLHGRYDRHLEQDIIHAQDTSKRK